jgi:hypothetical protein
LASPGWYPVSGRVPVWKVCIVRGRNPPRTFDALYIFTIKFSESPPRNFQTFQSGPCQCCELYQCLFSRAGGFIVRTLLIQERFMKVI